MHLQPKSPAIDDGVAAVPIICQRLNIDNPSIADGNSCLVTQDQNIEILRVLIAQAPGRDHITDLIGFLWSCSYFCHSIALHIIVKLIKDISAGCHPLANEHRLLFLSCCFSSHHDTAAGHIITIHKHKTSGGLMGLEYIKSNRSF